MDNARAALIADQHKGKGKDITKGMIDLDGLWLLLLMCIIIEPWVWEKTSRTLNNEKKHTWQGHVKKNNVTSQSRVRLNSNIFSDHWKIGRDVYAVTSGNKLTDDVCLQQCLAGKVLTDDEVNWLLQ